MTASRNFSRAVKRAAYARAAGRCENPACGIALPPGWGGIHYDHAINWALSRDSSLENCRCLCSACHLNKTVLYDIPVIAKVQRLADARIGIKRFSVKPLPAGRRSAISKKLNGEVVQRLPRNGKHRATMAKFYREFE